MKIKNMRPNAVYIGYRGIRPGFTLQSGQVSREINPSMYNNQRLRNDDKKDNIQILLSDSDRRFLGLKKEKKETPVEAPVEPTPAPAVEPVEEIEEEVVVEEPEVIAEEPVEEPEEVVEEVEEAEEPAAEPSYVGYELPKTASKMNKTDWCSAGKDLGIEDQVNMDMTGKELKAAVEARMEELSI